MSYPRMFKEELIEHGETFSLTVLELKNALLVFFNEGRETRLGTMAVSMPPINAQCASSILLGDRNTVMTRVFAEKFASATGKISLVSVYSQAESLEGTGSINVFLKMVKKALSLLSQGVEEPQK